MRFCIYQDITTLINSAYKNRGYAQVVATNLKQRRMYNLIMSRGRVLLDILRQFLNYEKIINGGDGFLPVWLQNRWLGFSGLSLKTDKYSLVI
jgi:hypothetical protein